MQSVRSNSRHANRVCAPRRPPRRRMGGRTRPRRLRDRRSPKWRRAPTAIAAGRAAERVWLLEHPPLYTAGTSARDSDLIDARFPVYRAGRGGQFTYHGPGQRVAYVMLDLKRRRPDVRAFVGALEALADRRACASRRHGRAPRADRVGVWVARPDKPRGIDGAMAEDKIAAIGVRVRRWVTFHGVALNVAPDLSHFSGIVPCGIARRALRRDQPSRSRAAPRRWPTPTPPCATPSPGLLDQPPAKSRSRARSRRRDRRAARDNR